MKDKKNMLMILSLMLTSIFIVISGIYISKYSYLKNASKDNNFKSLQLNIKFNNKQNEDIEYNFVEDDILTSYSLTDIIKQDGYGSKKEDNFIKVDISSGTFGSMIMGINGVMANDADGTFWSISSKTNSLCNIYPNNSCSVGSDLLFMQEVNEYTLSFDTWR